VRSAAVLKDLSVRRAGRSFTAVQDDTVPVAAERSGSICLMIY
jgi:hypothetical protein